MGESLENRLKNSAQMMVTKIIDIVRMRKYGKIEKVTKLYLRILRLYGLSKIQRRCIYEVRFPYIIGFIYSLYLEIDLWWKTEFI